MKKLLDRTLLPLMLIAVAACAGDADTDVDATAADAIVAARPIEDMTEVDAILAGSLDETQRDSVYARVWKRIDLNTASDEEILLIPGIGDRMLHEFKEYRPYDTIEKFRREIGKYVDAKEVSRLERYVTIGQ